MKRSESSSPRTPSGELSTFSEETPLHGVNQLLRNSLLVRTVFSFLLLACAMITASMVILTVLEFSDNPSHVSRKTVHLDYAPFPAVTLCNTNPVRRGHLESEQGSCQCEEEGEEEVVGSRTETEIGEKVENTDFLSRSRFKRDGHSNDCRCSPDLPPLSISYTDGYHGDRVSFMTNVYNSMSDDLRRDYGHQIKDMILSCRFQGQNCSGEDFVGFQDPTHGNCFTYIPKPQNVWASGLEGGLMLELSVERSQQLLVRQGSSLRVVIQPSSQVAALPDVHGVLVAPGTDTHLALQTTVTERWKDGKESCVEETFHEDPDLNLYKLYQKSVRYSKAACRASCLQKAFISACNCCDHRYPCPGNDTFLKDTDPDPYTTTAGNPLTWCSANDQACVGQVGQRLASGEISCADKCKELCSETKYDIQQSHGKWPQYADVNRLYQAMLCRHEQTCSKDSDTAHSTTGTTTASTAETIVTTTETTPNDEMPSTSQTITQPSTSVLTSARPSSSLPPFSSSPRVEESTNSRTSNSSLGEESTIPTEEGNTEYPDDTTMEEGSGLSFPPITTEEETIIPSTTGGSEISDPELPPYNLPQRRRRRQIENYDDNEIPNYPDENKGNSESIGNSESESESDLRKQIVENSALKLRVYFSSLDHHVITETSSFSWTRLLAAVGGHLAMWMGVSVLALLQLLWLPIKVVSSYCRQKKRNTVVQAFDA